MLMDAVLAVALGFVPVNDSGAATRVHVSPNQFAIEYKKKTDRRGTVHLRGVDPRGRAYYFTVTKGGFVDGYVGERQVSFHAAPAG